MAGTTTATTSRTGGVRKHTLAWTSDASGNVSGGTVSISSGTVAGVGFTPGAGGVQPTDAYDVTLLCADHGVDVLGGEGANLSNAAATHKVPLAVASSSLRMWLHGGTYQLVVANAGNAKSGSVDIYKIDGVA